MTAEPPTCSLEVPARAGARPCSCPTGAPDSGGLSDRVGVDAVELGDEVGGGFEASIGCCAQVSCRDGAPGAGAEAGQGVEGEPFNVGLVVAPSVVEDRGETFVGVGGSLCGVECG